MWFVRFHVSMMNELMFTCLLGHTQQRAYVVGSPLTNCMRLVRPSPKSKEREAQIRQDICVDRDGGSFHA